MLIKVKDHKNLRKDSVTGAIINIDDVGYNKYLERKQIAENKNKRIENVETELAALKRQMAELLKNIGENGGKEN